MQPIHYSYNANYKQQQKQQQPFNNHYTGQPVVAGNRSYRLEDIVGEKFFTVHRPLIIATRAINSITYTVSMTHAWLVDWHLNQTSHNRALSIHAPVVHPPAVKPRPHLSVSHAPTWMFFILKIEVQLFNCQLLDIDGTFNVNQIILGGHQSSQYITDKSSYMQLYVWNIPCTKALAV